ncbi:iron-sulfur cluster assembly accessory protein [Roseomonas terrae]|jgi:iron-sulfur cluster insertion protein|uniref:Iron-sulfur cluster assembly accessory protein n=1 Tax=Neoroseomonas terrae TaxID=424799 RepID=A0ABS5EEN2_9PROT|nr:iron-sulfur cluster assembly accessory protein [Neoroseomonas terrae]MBR0649477.1 iron-sulfur cluster assembly accessory protein [Neoroseomonas terrae]
MLDAAAPAFRVTERAHAQITEIATRDGRPEAGLRLAVEAGGCSGFQYRFGLEDAPEAEDLVVGDGSGRVFVDPVSLDLLAGAELDWAEELIGAHFAIRNPQAVSACGCGTSFSVG